jgi:lipopolysaccharide transport system ATP-binding protein
VGYAEALQMSSEFALEVKRVSKTYFRYSKPSDRLLPIALEHVAAICPPRLKEYIQGFIARFAAPIPVLKEVSLQVARGSTVAIIGRNGAGKSTLLQIICGTVAPTSGSVVLRGRVAALLELGAGFNPEYSGRENVSLYGQLLGLTRDEVERRIPAIEAFADIGTYIDNPVKTYSSGMFVRLAFAVVANVDADVLIIDEALAVGDVFFQQKCFRFLRSFKESGGTVLFVSHDTATVSNLCEQALLLYPHGVQPAVYGQSQDIVKLYLDEVYRERDAALGGSITSIAATSGTRNNADQLLIEGDRQIPSAYNVSDFRPDADSFGQRAGTIIDTWFSNPKGVRQRGFQSGATVILNIAVRADKEVRAPLWGFMLKDRLGQYIVTEGTDLAFRTRTVTLLAGGTYNARFQFTMPALVRGNYTLNVAFAEGVGDEHIQHHWIHDALVIQCTESRMVHGIAGTEDLSVSIERLN